MLSHLSHLGHLGVWLIAVAAPAAAVVFAVLWAFFPSGRVPRWRIRHMRVRVKLRLYPGRGHATLAELGRYWSRRAVYRQSGRARPSLTAAQRRRHPDAHSIRLGTAHLGRGLRVPVNQNVVVMSPPQAGKTAWLASVILHYPGPVLSTTTKHDVFQLTSGVRARGGPVHVFNPQRVGGVTSTFSWNLIEDCTDPATAIRRADAFTEGMSMKGVEDGSWWKGKASDYWRAFFHAAALAGYNFWHVARWVLAGGGEEAEEILYDHGNGEWASQLTELRSSADKTTATIRMSMSRILAFFYDPQLAVSVLPAPGYGLRIEEFLRDRGSLYLIAESRGEDSPLAPLFACLTTEIHYLASLLGSQMPTGRLDPPLLMALDEVTQICPVPVPSWLADSGGKGIQVITVAHGEAQLRSRWGPDGARAILDTSVTKLFLPGISDPAILNMASTLCGEAGLREHGDDLKYRHPVMTPDMIRELPDGHALVVRLNNRPVIAQLPKAWDDPAYKQARQDGQAVATLAPAPTAPPLPPAAHATRAAGVSSGAEARRVPRLMPPQVPPAPPPAAPPQPYEWNV